MTYYDEELTDDQWREANFSDTQIASARYTNAKQPSADELIAAAKKYGPEGILDTAILLTQRGYQRVEKALRRMR